MPPKIIYSSRTHSQLTQALHEARNTSYAPKICVLGSREQLCINKEVQELENNTAKTHVCRQKVLARRCEFHLNMEGRRVERDAAGVVSGSLDIEVSWARHCCTSLHLAAPSVFPPIPLVPVL